MINYDSYCIDLAVRSGFIKNGSDIDETFKDNYKSTVKYMMNYAESANIYLVSLVRCLFIKAMEYCLSSELFFNNFDVFYSLEEMNTPSYKTNLPYHLDRRLNQQQDKVQKYVNSIIDYLEKFKEPQQKHDEVLDLVLYTVQLVGDAYATMLKLKDYMVKKYKNSELLTMNEVCEIAGHTFCSLLKRDGYEIGGLDFIVDAKYNIVGKKDKESMYILISAQVAPVEPSFTQYNLDKLYEKATADNVKLYIASISVGSQDEKHFKDGVILRGDLAQIRVNVFRELELA